MENRTKLTLILSIVGLAAGSGLAFAQMDGPPPPDGPMQGFMRGHGRMADRFLGKFDLNHDDKVTHDELNKADGARFAAATHGAGGMTSEQFAAMHAPEFQRHTAEMFRRLDWNADGKLSLQEYVGPQRVRFESMDRDGSGAESCAANPVTQAAFQPGARPRGGHGFGRKNFCADDDLNRDGKVTRAEFDAATAKHFATLTSGAGAMTPAQFAADALARYREMSDRMFKRLDTNKDGKLSVAEFAAPDQKLFTRLDKNHDGTVTRDELTRHSVRGPRQSHG